MRTTLDLPDALMREVKVRAAQQDRKLKEVVEELIRVGLREAGGSQLPAPRKAAVKSPAAVRPSRPAKAEVVKTSAKKATHKKAKPETREKPNKPPLVAEDSVIDSSFPL